MVEPGPAMFPVLRTQPFDTWQIGVAPLPVWLPGEGKPDRAWIALCLSSDSGKALPSEIASREEIPRQLESLLQRAGQKWRSRPATVQTTDPDLAGCLTSLLAPHDVEVERVDELPELRHFLDELLDRFSPDDSRPSPLTGAGVTIEQLRAFARAAADLYASTCWRLLTEDDWIRVESPPVEEAFRQLLVSRRGPTLRGLLFFARPEDLYAVAQIDDESPELPSLPGRGFWTLDFQPAWVAPLADAEIWDRFDLPWAGGDRCPVTLLIGPQPERPDRRQLSFLEGLLAALTATSEQDLDSGRWRKRVSTTEGAMEFVLALPGLLEPEEEDDDPEPAFSWHVTERSMRDLGKLLQSQEFKSLEEANAFLSQRLATGELPHSEPESPEERAQEVLDRAWRARGRRAIQLARQALEIWPDCADAWSLLAARAPDPETARELYVRGVAAAERVLGPEIFREEAGRFWGILETRPYMRARQGLAEVLVDLDRLEEAAEHLQELLRLNPNDNLGVRDSLSHLLIALDRDAEAEELLDRYDEDPSAAMTYPRALLRFRKEGDSFEARRLLTRAERTNPFVPATLLGTRPLPPPSDLYAPGSEEEAVVYRLVAYKAWQHTPDALDWLQRRTAPPSRPHPKKGSTGKRRKKRRR
jgi:tetratricopeptide (TPR) repeat protein